MDNDKKEVLDRAENLYYRALEFDSAFALAYTGLAWVYWDKYYWETYLTVTFMDSALTLADIALSFDPQLSEAYIIRGNYYRRHNQKEQAIKEFDKSIKFNPNNWQAYREKGRLYFARDYVKHIEYLQKAASLHRGLFLPQIYRLIGMAYAHAGFQEKAIDYTNEAFMLDDDSAQYYTNLAWIEDTYGNFEKAIEFMEKCLAFDSTDLRVIGGIARNYMYLDKFEESLEYYKKFVEIRKPLNRPFAGYTIFLIGYAHWVNGFKEEADYYFNTGLETQNEIIGLDRHYGNLYALAGFSAFRGDRDKAYAYLRRINQRPWMPLFYIKN